MHGLRGCQRHFKYRSGGCWAVDSRTFPIAAGPRVGAMEKTEREGHGAAWRWFALQCRSALVRSPWRRKTRNEDQTIPSVILCQEKKKRTSLRSASTTTRILLPWNCARCIRCSRTRLRARAVSFASWTNLARTTSIHKIPLFPLMFRKRHKGPLLTLRSQQPDPDRGGRIARHLPIAGFGPGTRQVGEVQPGNANYPGGAGRPPGDDRINGLGSAERGRGRRQRRSLPRSPALSQLPWA